MIIDICFVRVSCVTITKFCSRWGSIYGAKNLGRNLLFLFLSCAPKFEGFLVLILPKFGIATGKWQKSLQLQLLDFHKSAFAKIFGGVVNWKMVEKPAIIECRLLGPMPLSRSESGLAPAEVGQLLLSSAADRRRRELITDHAAEIDRHTSYHNRCQNLY